LLLLLTTANSAAAPAPSPPSLALSHAWIVVEPGVKERAALEKAGFRIAPTVNHHDGQGTSSITVELLNGFLELIYPDKKVRISMAGYAGYEKFRMKSEWRTSGYSPIGIVFDRTPATPDTFPFPTWRVSAPWMERGTSIEMLTPKEMSKAVSLSISSHSHGIDERENEALARDSARGAMFHHPNGARRLTAVRVVVPSADRLPPAATYVADRGLVKFEVGDRWLLDVTLDEGKRGVTKDLQPELPLVVHY
jgi:hypothetical protein